MSNPGSTIEDPDMYQEVVCKMETILPPSYDSKQVAGVRQSSIEQLGQPDLGNEGIVEKAMEESSRTMRQASTHDASREIDNLRRQIDYKDTLIHELRRENAYKNARIRTLEMIVANIKSWVGLGMSMVAIVEHTVAQPNEL